MEMARSPGVSPGRQDHTRSRPILQTFPRADVRVRLDAGPSADNVLEIRLDYRVRQSQRRDSLVVALDLEPGEG